MSRNEMTAALNQQLRNYNRQNATKCTAMCNISLPGSTFRMLDIFKISVCDLVPFGYEQYYEVCPKK